LQIPDTKSVKMLLMSAVNAFTVVLWIAFSFRQEFTFFMSGVRNYSSIKAFTLVELLIAMVIFASVIAGGLACVRMGLNQIGNARSETRASQVMQSEIERLRSLAWNNFTALDGSDQNVDLSAEFSDAVYGSFNMKRSITGAGDSRKITLVIEWKDLSGASHTKSYVTQYTKGGLYDYIQ